VQGIKNMKILVINSGSSSLKFQLFAVPDLSVIASGLVEEIGEKQGAAQITAFVSDHGENTLKRNEQVSDHRQAIELMSQLLRESGVLAGSSQLAAIGHRVVHGGEEFYEPVRIDKAVIDAIERLVPLAPLHNPANLTGIRVAMEHVPDIPQVAVFDTAFHQTMPEHSYMYALPHELYDTMYVRRYGFHGTSHGYVAARAAEHLGRHIEELKIITLHLGNGASAAAISGGRSVDTSMGFTPLEGLIMGTRSGDFDPAILFYLGRERGMDMDALDRMVNKDSGLKGICGENDMRTITEAAARGDKLAGLALDMFCYRIKKYIGAYMAVLGTVDCIVFTGGIGENSAVVREKACEGLAGLGVCLDAAKNSRSGKKGIMEIHADGSTTRILVVPTDEELEIARQTMAVCGLG